MQAAHCVIPVIQVREGSVIVVVELEDNQDETGANITVLIIQLQEDVSIYMLVHVYT